MTEPDWNEYPQFILKTHSSLWGQVNKETNEMQLDDNKKCLVSLYEEILNLYKSIGTLLVESLTKNRASKNSILVLIRSFFEYNATLVILIQGWVRDENLLTQYRIWYANIQTIIEHRAELALSEEYKALVSKTLRYDYNFPFVKGRNDTEKTASISRLIESKFDKSSVKNLLLKPELVKDCSSSTQKMQRIYDLYKGTNKNITKDQFHYHFGYLSRIVHGSPVAEHHNKEFDENFKMTAFFVTTLLFSVTQDHASKIFDIRID